MSFKLVQCILLPFIELCLCNWLARCFPYAVFIGGLAQRKCTYFDLSKLVMSYGYLFHFLLSPSENSPFLPFFVDSLDISGTQYFRIQRYVSVSFNYTWRHHVVSYRSQLSLLSLYPGLQKQGHDFYSITGKIDTYEKPLDVAKRDLCCSKEGIFYFCQTVMYSVG